MTIAAPFEARGTRALRRACRRAVDARPDLGSRASPASWNVSALERLVGRTGPLDDSPQWRGGAGQKRFAVVELDGTVDGYAIYRHAPNWEGGFRRGQDGGRRGTRALPAGRARALALSPRHGVDEQASRRGGSCHSTTLCSLILSPSLEGCACASATASGCASSISERLWAPASYSAPGPLVVLPVERGPLEARGRQGKEDPCRGRRRPAT